jgi:hypothetical protein
MKTFAVSLVALAAISTVSFAADRAHDQYSSGAGYAKPMVDSSTSSNGFAVIQNWSKALTAAEIAVMNDNERNKN